jgi:hypothetical protein
VRTFGFVLIPPRTERTCSDSRGLAASVGYRLVQEIRRGRPAKPGPEWWLLLDLASDASDTTRRTACGYEYMAECTQASRATIFRWLGKLAKDGLLSVIEHSRSPGRGGGEGRRAVYEIQVPPKLRIVSNQVSPSVIPESGVIRSHKKGPDSGVNEVSPVVRPEYPAELGFSGNQVSPSMRPPTTDTSHRTGTGEGAQLRSEQDRSDEKGKKNTHPEREARRAPAA